MYLCAVGNDSCHPPSPCIALAINARRDHCMIKNEYCLIIQNIFTFDMQLVNFFKVTSYSLLISYQHKSCNACFIRPRVQKI